MKSLFKLAALFLSLAMILSLGACSGEPNTVYQSDVIDGSQIGRAHV